MTAPAQNLNEAKTRLSLEPLPDSATDYVDLSAARGSNCLAKLAARLRESAELSEPRCHLAFVGPRGSGKSTELLRMEKSLADVFFPVHLFIDATLEGDADYPDLFLWLVESIAERLREAKVPFDDKHTEAVANWFYAVTKFEKTATTSDMALETEASASVGGAWFGTGFKLLAKLKSAIKGSKESRDEMRREIKKRADELLQVVNNFLGQVTAALKAAGKPARLLIVQDNLDRLRRAAAVQLFKESGELIQQINAACVWTPPVATLLAPFNIGRIFQTFPMPMISVRRKNGGANETALRDLTALVAKRMDIGFTFENPGLVRELALVSGGSVRDLLRFIDEARLNAKVENHAVIEASDFQATVKQFALTLQNALTPGNIYLPILAEISLHKKFEADLDHGYSTEKVNTRREFFHSLIAEGAVLAYNGEENWYDVHPILHHLGDFKTALVAAQKPTP